ncbi:pseudaminic acid cytidylyltransferase [Gallaecimonas sp. GXIMD1310]|uniref:pseudaminic acid cytidylyltransferase n=1 Tax=Gallaecimonas sp. GXIMD1310 TaxID=3131926 RepID=UPI00324EAC75
MKDFHGKPMIAWSIEAAQASGVFDRVIVSTDDEEIAEVANSLGAETPFLRPVDLSDDFATTGQVMAHAVSTLAQLGIQAEIVCCLYATAPFTRAEDLKSAIEKLESSDADFVFSATSFEFPIQRALKLDAKGRVEMFQPEHLLTRSQDLEEAYHDAGQFYCGRAGAFLEQRPFFSPASLALILPRHRVQDIDTPEDWLRAEALFKVIETVSGE